MRDSEAIWRHAPKAQGYITRLAFAYVEDKGVDVDELLRKAGLSRELMKDTSAPLEARSQVKFLNLAAEALNDDLFGFHLSQVFDMRSIGLLYYVMASSNMLGEALRRGVRYSSIVNEGVRLSIRKGKGLCLVFEYVGIARRLDRHQIEFWMAAIIQMCRKITNRHVAADSIRFSHRRKATPELSKFFGSNIKFGADADETIFSHSAEHIPVMTADPYLNALLVKYCEESLANRKATRSSFGMSVENTVALLLPHGKAQAAEVARNLGLSQRTLARRLASEGLTFAGVLQALRSNLAERHLADRDLPISTIAWLLGYRDVSAFTNAFKRWTGRAPRAARQEL